MSHFPYQCYKNPKRNARPLRQQGKHHNLWQQTRKQWFKDNPADHYICYLCGRWLTPQQTTLDHVVARSHDASLRYDHSNLKPSCYTCNMEKGSKSYEQATKRF